MSQRDSLGYTFGVAGVLCVVCSLAVSAAAVALRPAQEENKLLDRQRNILDAAGLALGEKGKLAGALSKDEIAKLYERVEEKLVNLQTFLLGRAIPYIQGRYLTIKIYKLKRN